MVSRRLAVLAALLVLGCSVASAGTLEGRWVLVEETYGAGGLNLLREKPPQTLEFVREGPGLTGRTRLSPGSPVRPWPVFFADETTATVNVRELSIPPTEDRVRSRYLTPPAREDQVRLEVVEDYRVSEDGQTLTGTATVSFTLRGEPRGSFVLHRTFERRP